VGIKRKHENTGSDAHTGHKEKTSKTKHKKTPAVMHTLDNKKKHQKHKTRKHRQ
jgi:hypothetical protein